MHIIPKTFIYISIFNVLPTTVAYPGHAPSMVDRLRRDEGPPSTVSSDNFNECLDPNHTPKGQRVQTCTPKNTLDAQGDCSGLTPVGDTSIQASFCQVDVRWDYGPEMDLNVNCECSDPDCSITTTTSQQLTNTFAFSIGGTLKRRADEPASGLSGLKASDLMGIFNAGATWSYSASFTNTTAHSATKPHIASGKCGYYTFVPFYVTVCGTLSWQTVGKPQSGYSLDMGSGYTPSSPVSSQGGWCQTTPYTDAHGGPVGKTIFVATQCDQDAYLPFCWQDPVYLNVGVSRDPSVYNDYLDVHENFNISAKVESTPLIECELGHAPFEEGNIEPGCSAGLPSDVPLSHAYRKV